MPGRSTGYAERKEKGPWVMPGRSMGYAGRKGKKNPWVMLERSTGYAGRKGKRSSGYAREVHGLCREKLGNGTLC